MTEGTEMDSGVIVEDVVYATTQSSPLLARMYKPKGRGPFPAVVSIHGGRWGRETRLTNEVIDMAVASSGALVMALDFRMPPAFQYPTSVSDINFAIRWLKANALAFDINPAWIGGIGTSSGGHQLMLNIFRPRHGIYVAHEVALEEDVSADLRFAVLGWPVVDPLARYRMAKERNLPVYLEAHDAFWPDEAAMADANPQLILERGDDVALVPTLIIQGSKDEALTPDMAQRFAAAYKAAGAEVELKIFDDQPHTFVTKQPESPASQAAIARIVGFIGEQAARLRAQST